MFCVSRSVHVPLPRRSNYRGLGLGPAPSPAVLRSPRPFQAARPSARTAVWSRKQNNHPSLVPRTRQAQVKGPKSGAPEMTEQSQRASALARLPACAASFCPSAPDAPGSRQAHARGRRHGQRGSLAHRRGHDRLLRTREVSGLFRGSLRPPSLLLRPLLSRTQARRRPLCTMAQNPATEGGGASTRGGNPFPGLLSVSARCE